jgi:hypothetical protein
MSETGYLNCVNVICEIIGKQRNGLARQQCSCFIEVFLHRSQRNYMGCTAKKMISWVASVSHIWFKLNFTHIGGTEEAHVLFIKAKKKVASFPCSYSTLSLCRCCCSCTGSQVKLGMNAVSALWLSHFIIMLTPDTPQTKFLLDIRWKCLEDLEVNFAELWCLVYPGLKLE